MAFDGNRFTKSFGLRVPIVQGPMGGVAGPELVAAVADAGGLGVLPIWAESVEGAMRRVDATRALTTHPFGVNLRADLMQLDHMTAALERGASIIHLFWGDPGPVMREAARVGIGTFKLIVTVGGADAANAALDAGADALIAQGVEAGGHVLSEMPLDELLETVVPLAGNVPVIAAGGLADADDISRVMAMGAAGALLGTRFAATTESRAHDDYKKALMEAGPDSTARSTCFDDGWEDAPHRTLKNATWEMWHETENRKPGQRPGEGDVVLKLGDVPFTRYSVMPPIKGMTGDLQAGAMYAGTGVTKVKDCPSVSSVMAELSAALSG